MEVNELDRISIIEPMSKMEAQECVQAINTSAAEMGRLLLELKSREGWRALGYHTWTECLIREFAFSRKHLYELMQATPIIESLSPLGYNLNIRQANALSVYPAPLRPAIVMLTEQRYGKLTESRLERVGETLLQAARTGQVNVGDGSVTVALDVAIKLEDEEAMKRQWEYKNVGRTVISFKSVAELVARLKEYLNHEQLFELAQAFGQSPNTPVVA